MPRIRCFAQPRDPSVGSIVDLDATEWRHLQLVLRGRSGDRVTLFDGTGNQYSCKIRSGSRSCASLEIIELHRSQPPPFQLALGQALIKGRAMDLVVQKSTEIGIARLIPMASTRSVGPFSEARMARRQTKWRRIAIEACKQCGQPFLPRIDSLTEMETLCESVRNYHLKVIASLSSESVDYSHHFAKLLSPTDHPPSSRAIYLIGPEGDFTPEEYTMARDLDFQPLSLGRNILRAETAAIVAIGILNQELERLTRRFSDV